ncbi:MAG: SH3 domain-containing protein [Clostridia bacterium]|nr:SH3 domain-containing protein [Clostridia bacterium]
METNSLRRKLTAWSLILAICVLMIFPAALAESYEAEVTASTMVVRSGPSTSYEVVARLSKGTKVTVQSVSDGIAYISFSGKTGYALASDMKKVQSGSSSVSGLATVTAATAKVYKSASTSSQVLCTVKKGETFEVLSTDGTWAKLKNGTYIGYCKMSDLNIRAGVTPTPAAGSATPTPAPTPTPKPTVQPTPTGLATVKENKTKIFVSANTDSRVMCTVSKGSTFTILELTDKWAKLENGQYVGYVQRTKVNIVPGVTATPAANSTPKPTSNAPGAGAPIGTGRVDVNLVYIYQEPDASSPKLYPLYKNTKVNVYSSMNGWTRVEYNGIAGYVKSDGLSLTLGDVSADAPSLTPTPTPKPTAAPTATPRPTVNTGSAIGTGKISVNLTYMRAEPDASSARLCPLYKGTKLTVFSSNGGWTLAQYADYTGYVVTDAMKITLGQTPSGGPTPTPTIPVISENTSIPAFANCSAPIYEKASTSAKKLKTVSIGSDVTILGTAGEWTLAKNGNTKGYMLMAALTKVSDAVMTPNMNATAKVSASKATFYKYMSSSTQNMGSLKQGTEVTVLATDGTWALVKYKTNQGYCTVSSLTEIANPTINPGENTDGLVTSATNVYQYATTSSSKLTNLKADTRLTILGRAGAWALIEYSGRQGYVQTDCIQNLSAVTLKADEAYTATVTQAGTVKKYMYSGSGSAGSVSKGLKVNVLAHTTSWALIEKSGNTGYYPVSNLQIQLDEFGSPTVKTLEATVIRSASVYSTALESASKIGTIGPGENITITAYTSKWARINYGSRMGYVLRSYVSNASMTAIQSGSSSSSEVLRLQKALEDLGYFDGIPAGNYGSLTTSAVSRFQTQLGINATGATDVATLRVLYGGYAPSSGIKSASLQRNDTGTNVTRLQTRLTYKGYLSAGIDGEYGALTESAVKLYQKTAGLTETGKADSATLSSLFSSAAPKNKTSPITGATSGNSSGNASTGNYSTNAADDPSPGTGSASIETVVSNALAQLGKPYIYGTSGPNSYDCSGLTCYAYRKIGVSLGRSAYAQGYGKGTKIETVGELKRGDIVCMNTITDSDLCDHVGIYLGGGKFVHASSAAGKVIISSITKGYYNRVFSWGRRIL